MKKSDREEIEKMIDSKISELWKLIRPRTYGEIYGDEYESLIKEEPRYAYVDYGDGVGSHFPLPLTNEAKQVIIKRINDVSIKTVTIKKT